MDRIIRGNNIWLNNSNLRLPLAKAKLPDLERGMEKLTFGGGFFALEIPGEINPLASSFWLNGGHEYVRSEFGKEPGDYSDLYWYEALRDIRTESAKRDIGRVVFLKGLITDVKQPSIEGKKADQTEYGFKTIVDYRDIVDGVTIHQFTVQTNTLIINGNNYSEKFNSLIAAN